MTTFDRTRWVGRLLVAAAVLGMPGPVAAAENIPAVAKRWGLIGTWAIDCSVPPDRNEGGRYTFVIAGDDVVHRRNLGDVQDEIDVLAATAAEDGVLHLRIYLKALKEIRYWGLTRPTGATITTFYNHDEDQKYSIKDGNFVVTGKPTRSLRKCN